MCQVGLVPSDMRRQCATNLGAQGTARPAFCGGMTVDKRLVQLGQTTRDCPSPIGMRGDLFAGPAHYISHISCHLSPVGLVAIFAVAEAGSGTSTKS